MGIIIGIFIVAPTFYFIGKWLKDDQLNVGSDNSIHSLKIIKMAQTNEIRPEPLGAIVKSWLTGLVIFGSIPTLIILLFWLNSWDRLSPEEQAQVSKKHDLYIQDLKHCQIIVNREVINSNNSEFQRCNELLRGFEAEAATSDSQRSGPYEY
jgi:hypothetical protein